MREPAVYRITPIEIRAAKAVHLDAAGLDGIIDRRCRQRWTAEKVGDEGRKGYAGFGPGRLRSHHPPAALREREGRRFAGEGSPTGTATASPPPRPRSAAATLPAREARREGDDVSAKRCWNKTAVAKPDFDLNLDFTLPPRFASGRVGASPGRAAPAVPQPQAPPADREARRRPSRHAKRGGRVLTFRLNDDGTKPRLPNPMTTPTLTSPSRRASRAGGSALRRGGLPRRYRNRRPPPPTAKRGGDPPGTRNAAGG